MNNITIKVLVKGSIAIYKAKTNVLTGLKNGDSISLTFKRTEKSIEVFYEKMLCGNVNLTSIEENVLKNIKVDTEYEGIAVKQVGRDFEAEIYASDEESVYSQFSQIIKELKNKQLDDDIYEKIDYLRVSGIPDNIILDVLSNIKSYSSEMDSFLKKKPKNLFFEYDNLLKKSLIYLSKGYHLRFKGERGLGKNVLVDTLAWLYRKPIVEFNCHNGVDKTDIQGAKTLKEENNNTIIEFVISSIIQGAKEGAFINLDEANSVPPEVLLQIQSLADTNKKYIFIEGYGMVRANPDFKFLLTMNNGYAGTYQMNKATIDRFVTLEFNMPNSIDNLLEKIYPNVDKKVIKTCQKLYSGLKKDVEEGQLPPDVISIRGFRVTCDCYPLIGLRDLLIDNIANKEDSDDVVKDIIVSHIEDICGIK